MHPVPPCQLPSQLPQNLRQTNLKFELCAIAPILALGYGRSCCPELSVRLVKVIGPSAARARASALRARRASMHSSEMLGLGFWGLGRWLEDFFFGVGKLGGDFIFQRNFDGNNHGRSRGRCLLVTWHWPCYDHTMTFGTWSEHVKAASARRIGRSLNPDFIKYMRWIKFQRLENAEGLFSSKACDELYLFALISDSLDPRTGPQSLGPETKLKSYQHHSKI